MQLRLANHRDLPSASRVMQAAINNLSLKHGLPANRPLPPTDFPAFCLQEDPNGFWVAIKREKLIGFAFGWSSDDLWFLADLFIDPDAQAQGVGRALLDRLLERADELQVKNRALITFAHNLSSTGLYLHRSFYPREPLYRSSAESSRVNRTLITEAIAGTSTRMIEGVEQWMSDLDQGNIGLRAHHHEFLIGKGEHGLAVARAGHPLGYAYVSNKGAIGPVAAFESADLPAILGQALSYAVGAAPRASVIVPGAGEEALGLLSSLGFRLGEPLVLLAEKPFGDWRRYLPRDPSYM